MQEKGLENTGQSYAIRVAYIMQYALIKNKQYRLI
jgi:hypothetical protein